MEQEYLRVKVKGTWRSICTLCFRTAATGDSPASLADREHRHRCSDLLSGPVVPSSHYHDALENRERAR